VRTVAGPAATHPLPPSEPPLAAGERRCTRCCYDSTVAGITFDDAGRCSYCALHDQMDAQYPTGDAGRRILDGIADGIRAEGRGKRYDAIVGVSGGCDSTFMLHFATKVLGLRVLAVHFDNTWNSTIATENIHRALGTLDVDLETCVVDNEEYDDIHRAFLAAGVPDLEAPTDIGLATVLYRSAEKHGIRTILEGHSFRTEGVSPLGWLYMDAAYIADVHRRHGTRPMRTFPNLWMKDFVRWTAWRGIRKVRPLYWLDYRKSEVMPFLERELGWQWYGGHHLENRFTAFYHSYFLPRRWGIDGRSLGWSAACRMGEMDRTEALARLAEPPAFDPALVKMVRKRLGYTEAEFERLMTMDKHSWREYRTYKPTFERMRPFWWLMYRMGRVPKSFYVKFTASSR
jgi:N-acetyl sugar amidotransferase